MFSQEMVLGAQPAGLGVGVGVVISPHCMIPVNNLFDKFQFDM